MPRAKNWIAICAGFPALFFAREFIMRNRIFAIAVIAGTMAAPISAQAQTTPLLQAVRAGERVAVQRVIASGADVNAANRYGVTPLLLAAQRGRDDLIELLLKAGASVKTAAAVKPGLRRKTLSP